MAVNRPNTVYNPRTRRTESQAMQPEQAFFAPGSNPVGGGNVAPTGNPYQVGPAQGNMAPASGFDVNAYLQASGLSGAPQGTNYTQGPAGTAGGLTGSPTPQGYGQGPGQSNRGYYEQQTPVGSFAAADRMNPAQQQYSQAYTTGNQPSVMQYAKDIAGVATKDNPYLGQSTQQVQGAGTNAYAGNNPYLQSQIDATSADASKTFNNVINPQFDRAAQQSGSFGNTGVEAARGQAMGDFGKQLASTIGGMRMQDYTQQQGLAENALNRSQQVNLANAGFNAGDLSRNLSGAYTGQNIGMQGLGQVLGAGQFDASLGNNVGQFNAGQLGQSSMFNAGQGNQLGMYNTGQGNTMNMFNAGAGNQMLNRVGTQAWQGGENALNRNEGARQFDTNFDYTAARNSMFDPMTLQTQNLNNQVTGQNMAYQQQMQPLNMYQQLANIGATLGGQGGTNTQNLEGNPWLGALGGYLTGSKLWGG